MTAWHFLLLAMLPFLAGRKLFAGCVLLAASAAGNVMPDPLAYFAIDWIAAALLLGHPGYSRAIAGCFAAMALIDVAYLAGVEVPWSFVRALGWLQLLLLLVWALPRPHWQPAYQRR